MNHISENERLTCSLTTTSKWAHQAFRNILARMRVLFPLLLISVSAFGLDSAHLRRSVYKVNVVSQKPNFSQPWQLGRQSRGSGTGFYIGDGRILTNAHVVAGARYVTVQRDGDDHPTIVKIRYIAHDCDLAILEAESTDFFRDAAPLTFGGLPKLRRQVVTIGYPKGGEQISITEGIVSRISYRRYIHSGYHRHILVQVDSAINPGNSGGPVIQGKQVVGVAFQAHTGAENTGYIIPTPVVKRFLEDISDGKYDGHPDIGLMVLKGGLNNAAMRRYLHVEDDLGGVVVIFVASYTSTNGLIQKGDVLFEINHHPIGLDGKVIFEGERINFKAIFDLMQMGKKVVFSLLRKGKKLEVTVPVERSRRHHDLANIYPKFPRFDVFAGLIFSSLSRNYLKGWGANWYQDAPVHLRFIHWYSQILPRFKNVEELVVLSGRLPDPVNIEARRFEEAIVDEINGIPISKLEDIQAAIPKGDADFIQIKMWNHPVPIVMPRSDALKAHPDILKKYDVFPERWLK